MTKNLNLALTIGTAVAALVTAQAFEDQRLQHKARQDYMDKMGLTDEQSAVSHVNLTKNGSMSEAEAKLAMQKDRSLEDTSPLAQATPYQRPEGMPDEQRAWRDNFKALAPQVAESPLPTRQLKRMAAKQLSKSLSSVAKLHHRADKKQQRKRDRALAAAELHRKISSHKPTGA